MLRFITVIRYSELSLLQLKKIKVRYLMGLKEFFSVLVLTLLPFFSLHQAVKHNSNFVRIANQNSQLRGCVVW